MCSNNFWTSIKLETVILNISYCVILSALDFLLLESPFFLWQTILCHSPSTCFRANIHNHSNSKPGERTPLRDICLTNQFISPCQLQFGWGWTCDSGWIFGLIFEILSGLTCLLNCWKVSLELQEKVWLRMKANNKAEKWK